MDPAARKIRGSRGVTITICIPTCRRPQLLREALRSCLAQTRAAEEILIGDDSPDVESSRIVEEIQRETRAEIRYFRNSPSAGQGKNIEMLYGQVRTSHLLLLHDDDVLLPSALEELSACWNREPQLTAAFGKQYVMSHDGIRSEEQSEKLNKSYFRTAEFEGVQSPSWLPGLRQQFPNDGFLVQTEAARQIRWDPSAGNAGDYYFAIQLCTRFDGIYFLNRYTMSYRLTRGSISDSQRDAIYRSYDFLERLELPADAEPLRRQKLREFAPGAAVQALRTGNRARAMQLFWGENYSWKSRLTFRGLVNLAQLFVPAPAADYIRTRLGSPKVS